MDSCDNDIVWEHLTEPFIKQNQLTKCIYKGRWRGGELITFCQRIHQKGKKGLYCYLENSKKIIKEVIKEENAVQSKA